MNYANILEYYYPVGASYFCIDPIYNPEYTFNYSGKWSFVDTIVTGDYTIYRFVRRK